MTIPIGFLSVRVHGPWRRLFRPKKCFGQHMLITVSMRDFQELLIRLIGADLLSVYDKLDTWLVLESSYRNPCRLSDVEVWTVVLTWLRSKTANTTLMNTERYVVLWSQFFMTDDKTISQSMHNKSWESQSKRTWDQISSHDDVEFIN